MNEATKYNRAKTWQIALFALNMMSTNMYLFLMMYVSYYANGILGMSVVFVSTLATSMRIFDGFTDPIIGWLIDHSNGRFGKFRPFLVVGNALLALSMILLYKTTHLVPEHSGSHILLLCMHFTLLVIPFREQSQLLHRLYLQTIQNRDRFTVSLQAFLCCSYRPELQCLFPITLFRNMAE